MKLSPAIMGESTCLIGDQKETESVAWQESGKLPKS